MTSMDLENIIKICVWKTLAEVELPKEQVTYKPKKENYCIKCTGYRLKCKYYYGGEINS